MSQHSITTNYSIHDNSFDSNQLLEKCNYQSSRIKASMCVYNKYRMPESQQQSIIATMKNKIKFKSIDTV